MKTKKVKARTRNGVPSVIEGRVKGFDTNQSRVMRAHFAIDGQVLNYGYIATFIGGVKRYIAEIPRMTGSFTDCGLIDTRAVMLNDIV